MNPEDFEKNINHFIKERKYKKSECLVPYTMRNKCKGKIVKAHTIPKMCLKKISQDGHLFGFIKGMIPEVNYNKLSESIDKKAIEPKKIGIKEASIFTGFCQKHDNELFKIIEKNYGNFNCKKEECFLYSYRTLCREFFLKKIAKDDLKYLINKTKDGIQEWLLLRSVGIEQSIKDLEYYKNTFDNILRNRDYKNFKSLIVLFDRIPSVMASGASIPIYDFGGNRFKEIENFNKVPDIIFYNIVSYGEKGYAIFAWVEDSNKSESVAKKFVQSLRNVADSKKTDAIISFLFASCENIYFSPYWWSKLSENKKNILSNIFYKVVSPIEDFPDFSKIYIDNCFDDWNFSGVSDI